MSTGVTNSRPESSAHARAERSSASEPRTEAPMATPSASRVARTSLIAQRRSSGSMYTPWAASRSDVDLVEREHRPKAAQRMTLHLLLDDAQLLLLARVAEGGAEQEAVELRLRAAGTSPPARSGSPWRARGTASAARG